MTAAEIASPIDGVSLSARYFMALANAAMAGVVGTLTVGVIAGGVAALVMAVLPFMPIIRPAVSDWAVENPVGVALGGFVLAWILGTVVWGLAFAFGVALVLAPTMLVIIVGLTFIKPAPIRPLMSA